MNSRFDIVLKRKQIGWIFLNFVLNFTSQIVSCKVLCKKSGLMSQSNNLHWLRQDYNFYMSGCESISTNVLLWLLLWIWIDLNVQTAAKVDGNIVTEIFPRLPSLWWVPIQIAFRKVWILLHGCILVVFVFIFWDVCCYKGPCLLEQGWSLPTLAARMKSPLALAFLWCFQSHSIWLEE